MYCASALSLHAHAHAHAHMCMWHVHVVHCKPTACMHIARCMCMHTAAHGTSAHRWSTAAGSTLRGSTFPRRYARRGVKHTLLHTYHHSMRRALAHTLPASPSPRSSSARSPPASLSPSCSSRAPLSTMHALQSYWTACQPALSHDRPSVRPSRAARSPSACSTTARLAAWTLR